MKPGWRIFLRVLSLGLYQGSKFAKRNDVRDVLDLTSELIDETDPDRTPAQRPSAKRGQHRGLK